MGFGLDAVRGWTDSGSVAELHETKGFPKRIGKPCRFLPILALGRLRQGTAALGPLRGPPLTPRPRFPSLPRSPLAPGSAGPSRPCPACSPYAQPPAPVTP